MPESRATATRYRLHAKRRYWGKLLMLLLAGVVACHLAWGIWEGGRLDGELASLRHAGEPLREADFVPARVDPADNAVVDLRRAGAIVPQSYDDWENLDVDFLTAPLTPGEAERVRRVLDRYDPVLKHVQAAREKRAITWELVLPTPPGYTGLPNVGLQMEVANVVGLAVLRSHHDGDDTAALRHIDDLCFLARAIDGAPMLGPHHVATWVQDLAAERLWGIAPTLRVVGESGAAAAAATTTPGVARPQDLRAIIDLMLDAGPANQALTRALRADRVRQQETVRAVVDGRLAFRSVLQYVPQREIGHGDYAVRHLLKPGLLIDGRLMLQYSERAINASRAVDWPSASRRLGGARDEINERPLRHLLAYALTPDYSRPLRRHHVGLTHRRLAAAALAVRWYAVEHDGRLPASLDELVPRYLPAVPPDPMAEGRPLGYSPGPARPMVYSVGENGSDDGGSDTPWRTKSEDPGRWQRLDVIVDLLERPRRSVDVRLRHTDFPTSPAPVLVPTPPWATEPGD